MLKSRVRFAAFSYSGPRAARLRGEFESRTRHVANYIVRIIDELAADEFALRNCVKRGSCKSALSLFAARDPVICVLQRVYFMCFNKTVHMWTHFNTDENCRIKSWKSFVNWIHRLEYYNQIVTAKLVSEYQCKYVYYINMIIYIMIIRIFWSLKCNHASIIVTEM